jgi:hypothetical protein
MSTTPTMRAVMRTDALSMLSAVLKDWKPALIK